MPVYSCTKSQKAAYQELLPLAGSLFAAVTLVALGVLTYHQQIHLWINSPVTRTFAAGILVLSAIPFMINATYLWFAERA